MKKMFIVMVALLLTTICFGQEDLLNIKYEFSERKYAVGAEWGERLVSSGYIKFYEKESDYSIHIHVHENNSKLHLDLILNPNMEIKDGVYKDLTKMTFSCIVVKDYNDLIPIDTKTEVILWQTLDNTRASFTLDVGGVQHLLYIDTVSNLATNPIEVKTLTKW